MLSKVCKMPDESVSQVELTNLTSLIRVVKSSYLYSYNKKINNYIIIIIFIFFYCDQQQQQPQYK